MAENLWPTFPADTKVRSVRRVLLDAGQGLAERTEGRVEFLVETRLERDDGTRLTHRCSLYVRALNHHLPFCEVKEKGTPYPVTLTDVELFAGGVQAKDERSLLERLKDLFTSKSTRHTVSQLLEAIDAQYSRDP